MEGDLGEGAPKRYALSPEDFSDPPEETADYNFPERVDRQNFTDWLISGFEISRGDARAQAEWMKYIGFRTSFDPKKSLESFLKAGGMGALGLSERAGFEQKFNRVRTHKEEKVRIDEDFHEAIDAVMFKLDEDKEIVPNGTSFDPQVFLRALRERITQRKESLDYID